MGGDGEEEPDRALERGRHRDTEVGTPRKERGWGAGRSNVFLQGPGQRL